MITESFW